MQMQEGSLQLQFLFRLVHFKLHLWKSTVPYYLRGPILKMAILIVFQSEQPLCQHTDAVITSLNIAAAAATGCVSILGNSMIYLLFKKTIGCI